ncbi:MAG TPA: BMP family protein [Myxococcota bacterium]|nr:BMP family protein [Myxococcota bacterium]
MRGHSRRTLALALSLAVLALGAGACKDSGKSAAPAPAANGATPFRVALLTPGSIRDGGWNQSAYEGLERIHTELGAEIAHQETATPQDFETGFRDFAARGFDLVFGHGFEFQDAAAAVAKDYPKTVFVTTSGSTVRDNVAPIVFELEDATYLLGFAGARLSKTGKLGAVGGVKIPSVASTFTAFEGGAKAARPDAQVLVSYIGGWTDTAAAREATLAQIAGGADVLIHNANEAAAGFFQAVRESPGVWAFGSNKNQNDAAPDRVLASATLDVPRALVLVAKEVKSGEWKSRPLRFGLASGVIQVEWNERLRDKIPPELKAELDKLAADIASGALQVPRGSF